MLVLDELRYSEDHVWVRYEENHTVTLGITDFAQLQLGKLNYLELPNEGDEIATCESFGSVECSRLFNDLYSPVCGRVVSVNRDIIANPTLVNYSPYNRGWIIRAKVFSLHDLDMLMSSDDYEEFILTQSSAKTIPPRLS
ncbi:MAG: glycine cleavage system protein GcvH [Deltaproteobacteria bacterium]|nr:glycine cleavage system protein GcvH [Deltaproteobacteria bacterium]